MPLSTEMWSCSGWTGLDHFTATSLRFCRFAMMSCDSAAVGHLQTRPLMAEEPTRTMWLSSASLVYLEGKDMVQSVPTS